MVSIRLESTVRALMHPFAEFLGDHTSATRTVLRGVTGIDCDNHSPGLRRFAMENGEKLGPIHVMGGLSQMVILNHELRRDVLVNDDGVLPDQGSRSLLVGVPPLVDYPFMQPGYLPFGFLAPIAALLLPGPMPLGIRWVSGHEDVHVVRHDLHCLDFQPQFLSLLEQEGLHNAVSTSPTKTLRRYFGQNTM
ncbi:MAG: hypothetical protein M1602_03390 [Firmicutes bacterium]|nr:hypothetical protein [Bacillota bacterium]